MQQIPDEGISIASPETGLPSSTLKDAAGVGHAHSVRRSLYIRHALGP
jgi:hypothetical protein